MDWTEEDTLALTVANRVRQVICKHAPAKYSDLMDPENPDCEQLEVKVAHLVLIITAQGRVVVSDAETRKALFYLNPVKGRPLGSWDRQVIEDDVIPALDAEMVLDDLSRL